MAKTLFVTSALIGLLASAQVSSAQDRTASGTVTSFSLSFGTLTGSNTGGYNFQMYFSTPDGIPNEWPLGLFNGAASYEIMPSTPGGSTYSTDFAVYDTTHGYYYARGPMAISLPSTDSDGNGCPDALQVNRSFSNVGTATTSEYASPDGGNSWFYYGERSYTFTFNRNAGSALGSFNGSGYDPTSRSTSTFSGGFNVEGGTGNAVYNPTSRSITFGGNSFSFDTSGSGTSTYTRISDDQVSVAQFNFVTSDGYTRVIKAFTLNRSGGYYRAYPVELVDGDPRTSYADFKYCHVEIFDNNDADADGIPDLSDGGSKLNQSITFNSLPSKIYGDASFSLSASSSSGLGVSFGTSDSSIASVSGSTITINKAGSVTITASQSGNTSYNAASSVSQNLTINPKQLTIQADSKSKTAGSGEPALTYVSNGLQGVDSITGSLSRVVGETVGTYAITQGSLSAGSNYSIAFTGATFTISPSEQSTSPNQINIALGKTVTASSVYENNSNYSADRIVNGSTSETAGSYWMPKGASDSQSSPLPAWLVIDLGSTYQLSSISFLNARNSPFNDRGAKDFSVEKSLDGVSFSSTGLAGTLVWQNTSFQDYSFSASTSVRYLKVKFSSAYGPYGCAALNEVRVYGDLLYSMTASCDQTKGSINVSPNQANYQTGSLVTVSTSALPGYLFTSWSGDIAGTTASVTVTMDSNKSITANFGQDTRDSDADGLSNYQEIVTYSTNHNQKDSNGDGVEDGQAVTLGYSPTLNFSALISHLQSHPPTGLYTASQMQAMAFGDLVLTKNANGSFTLNYDIEQSSDLQSWLPYESFNLPLTNLPPDKAFIRIKVKQ